MQKKYLYAQYEQADFSHISPLWFAEFRGFFFGEGCVYIKANFTRNICGNMNSRKKLVPVIEISLRQDDRSVLEDIYNHLGGQLSDKKAHGATSAATSWKLVGWSRVYSVLFYLMNAEFRSRKLFQLNLMKRICELRFTMSHNLSEEEYGQIHALYLELRDLKLLKS